MEIKAGATGDGNSTPGSSFFTTDQASNVGTLSNFRQMSEINLGGSLDVTTEAMIAREIEKRRIKEEIITYGYLRRRELEDEVIREMMIEREIAMRHAKGVSLLNSPLLSVKSGIDGLISNHWKTRDALGLDERFANRLEGGISSRLSLANSLEGGNDGKILLANHVEDMIGGVMPFGNRLDDVIDRRLSLVNNRPERRGLDGLPFQRQSGGMSEVACKPVIDLRKAGPLAKSTATPNVGSKRKFETPTVDTDDGPTLTGSYKKSHKWWICEMCQVKATCEQGLRDHLKGKKHRAKEKAAQRTTESVKKGSENSEKPIEETFKLGELAIPTDNIGQNINNVVGGNQVVKNVEASSPEQQHADKDGGSGLGGKHNTGELKNVDTDFKFWCKLCEVGTTSESSMTVHRAGKKHMSLLKEKRGGVIAIKTVPDDVQYIDATKSSPADLEEEVALGNSDGQGEGVRADEPKNADICTMKAH